jgi:Zn-dependent peptidase ImmA (M78 family)
VIGLDPEVAAAEVLARAGMFGPPVDPVRVSHIWPSLRVTVAELDGAGYLISFDGLLGEVVLRSRDSAPRRRYTCAHELGHWLLEKNAHHPREHARSSIVERWCDRFAAALLMPATWMIAELTKTSFDIESIARLPAVFGVSRHAGLLRISELVPLEIGIVDISSSGLEYKWTTARSRRGRFSWITPEWIASHLRRDHGKVHVRSDGLEFQAMPIANSRWMVTLASAAALLNWRESVCALIDDIASDGHGLGDRKMAAEAQKMA